MTHGAGIDIRIAVAVAADPASHLQERRKLTLRGRMPWVAPEFYSPSMVEWGISIGLIAATIFLFGLAARLMPVLPAEERRSSVMVHM